MTVALQDGSFSTDSRREEEPVHDDIAQTPTSTTMVLRAFARFPGRMAFVWDGGSLTPIAARTT